MGQLRMVWKDKEPVPYHLAEGCRIIDSTTKEFSHDELADGWTEICTELCGGTRWTREQFYQNHWNDPLIPADGIFFAVNAEGRLFSTATVQVRPGHIGNLHMVGTSMDCKGLGGGRAVCTQVIRYFQKHEIKLAYLNTDDFRIPAIKIYLGLGYRPYLYNDEMPERWHKLMDLFGIRELEACDADLHDMKMFSMDF